MNSHYSNSRDNSIEILRIIAIAFIVMHHVSYAFYGWPKLYPVGSVLPEWLATLSPILRHIGLSCFTFISGYVLWYQNKKKQDFRSFLYKKIKRILIPCFFYAFVFLLLFRSCMDSNPIGQTHLWYLPMIFLCIIISSARFYTKYYLLALGGGYLIIKFISHYILLHEIYSFCEYIPVFYLGFLCNQLRINKVVSRNCRFLISIACCLTSVVIEVYHIPHCYTIQMCSTSLGLYILTYTIFDQYSIVKPFRDIAYYSFSIYLLHQFVLNTVLMHTNLAYLNPYTTVILLFIPAFVFPIWIAKSYEKIRNLLRQILKQICNTHQ